LGKSITHIIKNALLKRAEFFLGEKEKCYSNSQKQVFSETIKFKQVISGRLSTPSGILDTQTSWQSS